MLSPLTRRQKELLDYINTMVTLNGYAPSLQEIRDKFSLKAISTVHEHLENLKNKGYIRKEMNQARGISIANIEELEKHKTIKVSARLIQGRVRNYVSRREEIIIDKKLLKNPKLDAFAVFISDDSGKVFNFHKNDVVIIEKGARTLKGSIILQKYSKIKVLELATKKEDEQNEGVCVSIIRPL